MELLVGSFFDQSWLSDQVVVSCRLSVVEPKSSKLFGMSGVLSLVVWFLGPVFTKKTRPALAFYFSSSNKNSGKTFAVLSKKLKTCISVQTHICMGLWVSLFNILVLFLCL